MGTGSPSTPEPAVTPMPTISTRHHESTLTTEEEFLAIVCSDEDLMRAEFDAIIAAEWPSPPPDRPENDDLVEPAPRTVRRPPIPNQARRPDQPRGIRGRSRERSPPPAPAGGGTGRQVGPDLNQPPRGDRSLARACEAATTGAPPAPPGTPAPGRTTQQPHSWSRPLRQPGPRAVS